MTCHTATRWSRWEKIAGLDGEGPLTTQCGIEFWDLPVADRIRKDNAPDVDCPACLAPSPTEQETELREYLESIGTRGPYESTAGWALRELRERINAG